MPTCLSALLLALACLSCSCSAWQFCGAYAPDLQPFFAPRENGWMGADVGTSVFLFNDTFMWIWGDTLIGYIANNTRQLKAMPRNSIALMQALDSKPSPLTFYYRYNTSDALNFGFFSPANKSQWFWPTNAVMISGKLYFFGGLIAMNGTGAWGFVGVGSVVIRVPNPTANPMEWTYDYTLLPHSNSTWTFGEASVIDGSYLYLFGQESSWNTAVARISTTDVAAWNWSALQYWAAPGQWAPFSSSLRLQSLFAMAMPETTLTYHPMLKLWYTPQIVFASKEIYLRTAPQITGPWSDPINVLTVGAPYTDASTFIYAPKAHPELAASNEIVISFASNSPNETIVFDDLALYVPTLVRVTITP